MIGGEWWRFIPHPSYGNYGGVYNSKKCGEPIDDLDYLFLCHDIELMDNNPNADINLCNGLKEIDFMSLGLYGFFYRLGALIVFSIITKTRR